jgi:hypothetical protein
MKFSMKFYLGQCYNIRVSVPTNADSFFLFPNSQSLTVIVYFVCLLNAVAVKCL